MDKSRLFQYLEEQDPRVWFDLLQVSFDEMTIKQRHTVFDKIAEKIPPSPIDGEELLEEITVFYDDSLGGRYYAPFDINSKNFMHIPEETEEWFDQLGDLLEKSRMLSEQGDHQRAVKCFGLLYDLIEQMENGEEIVFADEYGSWMIPVEEKECLDAYISSLAIVSTAEEYAKATLPLIRRDSYESFCNKVYSTVMNAANADTDQKAYVKEEVKRQNIRTKPRY